jgi:hypothetical protein
MSCHHNAKIVLLNEPILRKKPLGDGELCLAVQTAEEIIKDKEGAPRI